MFYNISTRYFLFIFIAFFIYNKSFAMEVPVYDFPISAYSQVSNYYLPASKADYDTNLLSSSYQNSQLKQFYNHFFESNSQGLSPWSPQMIRAAIPLVKKIEMQVLEDFNNQSKTSEEKHYAENFKEHDEDWWLNIKRNMSLDSISQEYKEESRAIIVTSTFARALPEHAPDFFHASLPGQGFPFDNLQEAAIWTGTPVYVFSVSRDKAWSLVLTPDSYFAWVKSSDIAYTSASFINEWQESAKQQLIAITQTEATIVDEAKSFLFSGYIGSVFPMVKRNALQTSILVPVKSSHNQAIIKTGYISSAAASPMPLAASTRNFVKLINQLKSRPYGWGGAYFFNDCSQETKSIFAPFGIWLPRNSALQAKLGSGLDLSKAGLNDRLKLLKEKGHPLMTLIYSGGHVMLYIGTRNNTAITYQDVWALSSAAKDKRFVIGQSVFFPLLSHYPENPDAQSQANKTYFKLVFLDELPESSVLPEVFASNFLAAHVAQDK